MIHGILFDTFHWLGLLQAATRHVQNLWERATCKEEKVPLTIWKLPEPQSQLARLRYPPTYKFTT